MHCPNVRHAMLPSTHEVETHYKTSVYPLYKQRRHNLLTLPAEIRDNIWHKIIGGEGSLYIVHSRLQRERIRINWSFVLYRAMVKDDLTKSRQTCKLMHDEILSVCHRSTKYLDMYIGPLEIPATVPVSVLRSIKCLRVYADPWPGVIIAKLAALELLVLTKTPGSLFSHTARNLRQIARAHAHDEFLRLDIESRVDAKIDVHVEVGSLSVNYHKHRAGEEVVSSMFPMKFIND